MLASAVQTSSGSISGAYAVSREDNSIRAVLHHRRVCVHIYTILQANTYVVVFASNEAEHICNLPATLCASIDRQ
jgi:hypothetical protein